MLDISTVSVYIKDMQHMYAVVCCKDNVFMIVYEKMYVYTSTLTSADNPLLLDFRTGSEYTWYSCISSVLQRLHMPHNPVACHEVLLHRYTAACLRDMQSVSDELYERMSAHNLPLKTFIKLGSEKGVILSSDTELFICTVKYTSYIFDRNLNVYASDSSYEKLLGNFMVKHVTYSWESNKAGREIRNALKEIIISYDFARDLSNQTNYS